MHAKNLHGITRPICLNDMRIRMRIEIFVKNFSVFFKLIQVIIKSTNLDQVMQKNICFSIYLFRHITKVNLINLQSHFL